MSLETQHVSYREILSQEMAWQEAVQVTLSARQQILELFDNQQPGEIIFAGCTSPHYGASAVVPFWEAATGIPARAVTSSELVMFPELIAKEIEREPLLFAWSRSGKTSETIWAAETFTKRYPGRVMLLSCNPQGPLAEIAVLKLILEKSNETTIPQTRSLSAMILTALLIACIVGKQETTLRQLVESPTWVRNNVKNCEVQIATLMEARRFSRIFFLGSGSLYPIAREGALKCMEMANSDAYAFPMLESRHGPRAIIDENSLVVGLYSWAGRKYEAALMEEYTHYHHATTLALVPEPGWETGLVTASIAVDSTWDDSLIGLSYLPLVHLLAYHCAVNKGLNPDITRMHTLFVEIEKF